MTTPSYGQPGGTGPNPLVGLPAPAPPIPPLASLATTGPAGFPLQDATPTILTWTAPADGFIHRVLVNCAWHVTSTETGGVVQVEITLPDGTTKGNELSAGGQAGGEYFSLTGYLVEPGSSVSLDQTSALTAGAALWWAEFYGA